MWVHYRVTAAEGNTSLFSRRILLYSENLEEILYMWTLRKMTLAQFFFFFNFTDGSFLTLQLFKAELFLVVWNMHLISPPVPTPTPTKCTHTHTH